MEEAMCPATSFIYKRKESLLLHTKMGPKTGPFIRLKRLTDKQINDIRRNGLRGNVKIEDNYGDHSSTSDNDIRPSRLRRANGKPIYYVQDDVDDDDEDKYRQKIAKKEKERKRRATKYSLKIFIKDERSSYRKAMCQFCKQDDRLQLLLCCDDCPWVFHAQCLTPPLKTELLNDQDLLHVPCPRCVIAAEPFSINVQEKPDRILSWRFTETSNDDTDDDVPLILLRYNRQRQRSREFFIHFTRTSYWDCEWVSEMKLKVHHPQLLAHYLRRDMTEPPTFDFEHYDYKMEKIKADDPLNQEYYKYGVKPEWLKIHRVVTHTIGHDGTATYLIKWRGLPYGLATWELQSKMTKLIPEFIAAAEIYLERRLAGLTGRPKKYTNMVNYNFKHIQLPPESPVSDLSIMFEDQPPFVDEAKGLSLHPFQLDGLNWLRYSWSQKVNTILADEMGLGKTIQTIVFLYSLYKEGHCRGPFLISAPLSTIINWEREFETWAPDFYVVTYSGDKDTRTVIRQHELSYDEDEVRRGSRLCRLKGHVKFHVLLTSYELLTKDAACLGSIRWKMIIVDESHRLRDNEAKLFKCLSEYYTKYRLLLTGTPLQNNLKELFCLLNFLCPEKFCSLSNFQQEFTDVSKEEQITKLHNLLGPHLLRRLKADVLKDLPSKSELIVGVELTSMQKKFYKYVLTKNFKGLNADTGGRSTSLLNVMMDLRKCCNHPYLFGAATADAPLTEGGHYEVEALTKACGKLILLQKLLRVLREDGHRVLIFSQMTKMLDILEDFLMGEGYMYERIDGGITGDKRQDAIDRFNAPGASPFAFLLSTKAGGLGINLTSADTVIVYDSDWNPHNDIQAFSRAHRIGQLNKVMIYRLVTRNSVEEKIAQVAKRKLMLTHLVVRPGMGNLNSSFSSSELQDIIRFGTEKLFKDENEEEKPSDLYSDEAIKQLVDRNREEGEVKDNWINEYLSSFKVMNYTINEDENVEVRNDIDIDYEDSSAENINPLYWQKWLGQLQRLDEQTDVKPKLTVDEVFTPANRKRRESKVVSYASNPESDEKIKKRIVGTRTTVHKISSSKKSPVVKTRASRQK